MMMLGISIRKAQQRDAKRILEISRLSIFDIHDFLYPKNDKKSLVLKNIEEITSLITSKNNNFWVATIFGKVVGFGISKGNTVDKLYVHPKHQKQGVASMLLKQLEKSLIKPIFKVSKNSVTFYENRGYKVQGKSTKTVNNKKFDSFVVYKD
ncbi:MAG: GNAT family N-acetyltransferase [Proteobacteria bacterium]|nr:GNAT family N-acetyltransferase [Pseudomonadota bacterium]